MAIKCSHFYHTSHRMGKGYAIVVSSQSIIASLPDSKLIRNVKAILFATLFQQWM